MRRPPLFINTLLVISSIILLSVSTIANANSKDFHSPYFDISLPSNLTLISNTEEKDVDFHRYIFSSSNTENAELQMRVIVSDKKPEANQSLESFQTASVGAMIAMYMNSLQLYQYIGTPENQKVLSGKPFKLKLGNNSFSGATMYFGNTVATFLVTHLNNKTYAFTLVSTNSNEQIRKNNLKKLTRQLQSVKFI